MLHFCNPQTEGEVVGGGGGIFVTRDWGMLLGCGRGCIEWGLFVVGQCKIDAHKLDYYVIILYICSV